MIRLFQEHVTEMKDNTAGVLVMQGDGGTGHGGFGVITEEALAEDMESKVTEIKNMEQMIVSYLTDGFQHKIVVRYSFKSMYFSQDTYLLTHFKLKYEK